MQLLVLWLTENSSGLTSVDAHFRCCIDELGLYDAMQCDDCCLEQL